MRPSIAGLLSAVLILAPLQSFANNDYFYQCRVEHVYNLTQEGVIRITPEWESSFIGSTFQVSKRTGAIAGDTLTTIFANDTQVVNAGSSENSFKALAFFDSQGGGGQVQLIEIQEFITGKQKPFVASSMGGAGIVTGVCIHKN